MLAAARSGARTGHLCSLWADPVIVPPRAQGGLSMGATVQAAAGYQHLGNPPNFLEQVLNDWVRLHCIKQPADGIYVPLVDAREFQNDESACRC